MSEESAPKLLVVLVTLDGPGALRGTLSALQAQTVRDRLEIVIVAPSVSHRDRRALDSYEFDRVCWVEVGEIPSTARARAEGIKRAGAPLVALGENHSFPGPQWAEALIAAHQQPWAVVGPEIRNGNPDSLMSWAGCFLNSSRWMEPAERGVLDDLQGRNGCYKRDLLLAYGEELGAMLEIEVILHWDLRAHGHQLLLEPAARTYHRNLTALPDLIEEQFYVGRLFAASRKRKWAMWKRLLFSGGSPLIPLLRLWRIVRELRRVGRPRHLIGPTLPIMIIGLVAGSVGELLGYAFGAGGASRHLAAIELHRSRGSGQNA
jgi:hypothetical protein